MLVAFNNNRIVLIVMMAVVCGTVTLLPLPVGHAVVTANDATVSATIHVRLIQGTAYLDIRAKDPDGIDSIAIENPRSGTGAQLKIRWLGTPRREITRKVNLTEVLPKARVGEFIVRVGDTRRQEVMLSVRPAYGILDVLSR